MTDKQEIIDTLFTALHNLVERDLIGDRAGDHMKEVTNALAMARDDTDYVVQCPVCHNKSVVYHNAWSSLTCIANDCDGTVVNPQPSNGEGYSRVEQAEADAHNAKLSLKRAKRILGNKHSPV